MSEKQTNLHIRIEPEVKEEAESILTSLGITSSDAISLFYKEIILQKGLPFEMKLQSSKSADDIVELDPVPYNPAYEENLPSFLEEDIALLRDEKNKSSPFYDCYLDETNSSINVCEVENLITKEQADYLRKKYLGM